jgi:hypothetical protein
MKYSAGMSSEVNVVKQNGLKRPLLKAFHLRFIAFATYLYISLLIFRNVLGQNQIYGVIFLVLLTFLSLPRKTSKNLSGGILFSLFFSCLIILWGWFGPLNPEAANFGLEIATCFALSYVMGIWLKPQKFSLTRFIGINSIKSVALTLLFAIIPIRSMLKILTWGYDNSAHLPAFFQVYSHNGFVFAGNISSENTFSNYLNGYPPLQSATWAALVKITSLGNLDASNFLRLYFFFYISTILLTLLLTLKIIRQTQSNSKYSRFVFFAAIFVFFSSYSNVFWSGYPSFEWGVIQCLIWFSIYLNPNVSLKTKLITGILCSGLVFYSYQLLFPPIAVLICFLFVSTFRAGDFSASYLRKVSLATIFALAIGLPFLRVARNTPTFVLNTGGIEPIPFLIILLLIVFLWLASFKLKTKQVSDGVKILQVLFAYFAALAIYSQLNNGAVSYYIQKVGYLLFLFCIVFLFILLVNFDFTSKNRNPTLLSSLALSLGLVLVSPFLPKAFSSAFMGGTVQVAQTLLMESKGQYRNRGAECVLNSLEYSTPERSPFNVKILLPSEVSSGDIESRWLNSVDMRLSDAVYELLIPIGMKFDSVSNIIDKWSVKYPDYKIIAYADETANTEGLTQIRINRVSC